MRAVGRKNHVILSPDDEGWRPARAEELLDTGHFALEDKGGDIAALMLDFLDRKLPRK